MAEPKPVTLIYSVPRTIRRQRRKYPNPGKGFRPPAATENTPLNNSQKAFVRMIAEGLTPSAAAHQCGYKHPAQRANQLIKLPHIQKALRAAREEFAKASAMSKKKVMDGFLDAISQAKMLGDPSAQIQGWNSVAKMCGYFEPTRHKIEVDVKGRVIVERLQTLSDDDLLKLASGDANVLEAEYVQEEDILSLPSPSSSEHTETHDE